MAITRSLSRHTIFHGTAVGLAVLLAMAVPAAAQEPEFVEHVIQTADYDWPSLELSDLDGDGDIDILTSTRYGSIRWYENRGGVPPAFQEHDPQHGADTCQADAPGEQGENRHASQ